MLLAGIVVQDDECRTANLVHSILSSTGRKVSIVDSKSLDGLDFQRVRNYIAELDRNNTDVLLFKIDIRDAGKEVFDNLHFDVMICADKADDLRGMEEEAYLKQMRRIFSLLEEKGIAIVNVDDGELIWFLQGMKYYVVTYGFNSKASVTTSSVGDTGFKESFICCLQRTIPARNGLLFEPQEYSIHVEPNQFSTYNVLAAATFAIVNGVDLNMVNFMQMKN